MEILSSFGDFGWPITVHLIGRWFLFWQDSLKKRYLGPIWFFGFYWSPYILPSQLGPNTSCAGVFFVFKKSTCQIFNRLDLQQWFFKGNQWVLSPDHKDIIKAFPKIVVPQNEWFIMENHGKPY